ncbi:MAG: hypothetical protein J6V66_03280, partial [Clostridia bacterium]|nr:hypothetical protein [Clostridia bacterium]
MKELILNFIDESSAIFKSFGVYDGVLVFLLLLLNFFIFGVLRKNNASKISIVYFFYVLFLGFITIISDLTRVEFIIFYVAFVLCIILLFATEIKRAVWNVKTKTHQPKEVSSAVKSSAKLVTQYINEIIKAIQNMSKNDTGAIIVLSNTKIPDNIVSS